MMKKKIIAVICATMMIFPTLSVNAQYKEKDLKDAINDAIDWKEDNDSPFHSIGMYGSDFYIMALNRMGKDYDYSEYLAGLDGIAAGYGEEHNASDMQRTVLSTVASGGDAGNVGGRDLVAEGIYYRNAVSPIDKEGVNGYSWALIALDSNKFEIPEWGLVSRNDIIAGILSHQNTDGSFDNDIYATAAAITALAPYYENSGAYTITQNQTGWIFDLSPRDAVDSAIDYLSEEQSKDGDFIDLKSTAMTIIALDTMGIDPDDDRRFDAKKGTALDGLMMYQEKDGGFSADLNKSDGDATSLAICALASQLRLMQEKSAFFNFTVDDKLVFETQAPATTKPTSSTTTATKKPTTTVTVKPSTTKQPTSTTKPTSSLKPTKTTTPMSSTSPKPSSTPRVTKRPALVGPIEMPGPMPTATPEEMLPMHEGERTDGRKSGNAAIVIVGIVAILSVAGIVLVLYLNRNDKLSKQNIMKILLPTKKDSKNEKYTPKNHRKTAQRRCFDERAKFKNRRKFDKRRRK